MSSASIRAVCDSRARSRISIRCSPLVVEGDVVEARRVEIAVEIGVDDVQHVAVELRGHAGGVVVGGLERRPVLDQVGADQEPVVGPEHRAHAAQERAPLAAVEVAERAAEEGDQPPPAVRAQALAGPARSRRRRRGSRGRRTSRARRAAELAHRALGDVDRHVGASPARRDHRVEQRVRLARRARAELDQLLGRGLATISARDAVEDLLLGARRVVLGQRA